LRLRQHRRQQQFASGLLVVAAVSVLVLLGLAGRAPPDARLTVSDTPRTPALDLANMALDERWLASLPEEPAIARATMRAPAASLEDHIAWLDDTLSTVSSTVAPRAADPALVGRLQAQRAQLVDALVRVRYAEEIADLAY
jgi:hypothetical protein